MKTATHLAHLTTLTAVGAPGASSFVVYCQEREGWAVGTRPATEPLPPGSNVLEAWTWRQDGCWVRLALHGYGETEFVFSDRTGWETKVSGCHITEELAKGIASAALERLRSLGLNGPVDTIRIGGHEENSFVAFQQLGEKVDTRHGSQALPSNSIPLEAWGWYRGRWIRVVLNQLGGINFHHEQGSSWSFEVGTSHPVCLEIGCAVVAQLKELRTFSSQHR